jgi:hypothetical protein
MLFAAACANPEASVGRTGAPFAIITSEGIVLVTVEGGATGFTNADLTRLIRKSLAETYPVQCNTRLDSSTVARQMVWHVANLGWWPTAMISVKVIEDEKKAKSGFDRIAVPGVNPDAVFLYDVSRLAQRILPPPRTSIATLGATCS